ncbi:MAG: cell division protein FtsL [Myxococcales bacterium]|nr:cell division protein FtsL [Myxococcales bacterium]
MQTSFNNQSLPWGIKPLLYTALVVAALVGMGLYHVWFHYRIMELGRTLSTETEIHAELTEAQRKLKLELSSLKRTDEIRAQAVERFGMRIPERSDYVIVQTKDSLK